MDEGELLVRFDTERFGVVDKANSKHVDILPITIPVTKKCELGLATEKWRRMRSEEDEMDTGPEPYHEVRP